MWRPSLLALAILTATGGLALADQDTEARLREALRTATSQLRALEDERTALQARIAVAEKERDALKAQVAATRDQLANARKDTAAEAGKVAELETRASEQATALDRVQGVLGQCRTANDKAVTIGKSLEEEGRRLSAELDGQRGRAESCEAKNIELYRVGSEILDAYAGVGLGDVVATREPFLGLKRVELENLVQDYRDKLADGKVKP